MGMVDVTEKPVVRRLAEAAGRIVLSPGTSRRPHSSFARDDP